MSRRNRCEGFPRKDNQKIGEGEKKEGNRPEMEKEALERKRKESSASHAAPAKDVPAKTEVSLTTSAHGE